jgi:hypothetical protein
MTPVHGSTRQYTAGTRQYRAVRTGLGWLCTVIDRGVSLQQLQSYIPLRIGMYSSRSFLMHALWKALW